MELPDDLVIRVSYSSDDMFDDAIIELAKLVIESTKDKDYLKPKYANHFTDSRVPTNYIQIYLKDTRSL